MDEEDKAVTAPSVRDVHKALGMWPIRRALAVAFSGAALLLVAAWYLVSWMLGSPAKANGQPLDTNAQLDLLKLVFALVAGVGALVALVTAYRRQRIEEAASERAERIQAHAEQVARDNAHDATERRVTDLYGKAVEQIGHDNAAVRLGGLYALERLAQDHPQHRQTVVDVVCAYLRMPFPDTAPTTTKPRPEQASQSLPSERQGDSRQELQVRLTAQRLLARHLKIKRPSVEDLPPTFPNSYWYEINLDLTGAHLINLDLSDCWPHDADFTGAWFSEIARFAGARFGGTVRFAGVQFDGTAQFEAVRFGGTAQFEAVQFDGEAVFSGAQFNEAAIFVGARFSEIAWFGRAHFGGTAWFDGAEFNRLAQFSGVRFNKYVQFNGAHFKRWARFDLAQFNESANFGAVRFSGTARFDEAQFNGAAMLAAATCLPNDQHRWVPGWRTGSPAPDQDMVPLIGKQ